MLQGGVHAVSPSILEDRMLRSVFPVLIVALAGDLLRVLSAEGVCLIGLLSVGFLEFLDNGIHVVRITC